VCSGAAKKGWRDSASLGLIKGGEDGARILLGGLKIGSTGFTLSYRRVKEPAAGYRFTVPKLKSRHREYLEDEGLFGGFLDKVFD
jgi:hypothetical protein